MSTIKIFLNKIHINIYSIIIIFLSLLGGLFKEISIVSIIIIIHEFGHFIAFKHYNWNVTKIELLPFHTMAFEKYKKLNIKNPFENIEAMNKEECLKLEEYITKKLFKNE